MKICLRIGGAPALVLAFVLALTAVRADQLGQKKVLTLSVAKQLAAAAEQEGVKNKWTGTIAIVDDAGNLIYLERMDDSLLSSIDLATEKARVAVKYGRPTKTFRDSIAGGNNIFITFPGMVAGVGGFPLMADGKIIGGIAASGNNADVETLVSTAGVSALAKIIGQ
jgi:uncharacterized protein GlcG (DUF336 family)